MNLYHYLLKLVFTRDKMAKKRVFIVGFFITLTLLIGVLFSNLIFNNLREDALMVRMSDMISDYEEIQTLILMADFFGEESACIALEGLLSEMNKDLWGLGMKIDQYRQVTEEFTESEFYFTQKKLFNQRAVLYYTTMRRMQEMCNLDQVIMTFFYKNSEDCPECDPLSFVLTDIRQDLDRMGIVDRLPLFSFDVDLDLAGINILLRHYNITEFPCVVLNENVFCGLKNKNEMKDIICIYGSEELCY